METENDNSPPEDVDILCKSGVNLVEIPVVKKTRHLAYFVPQRSPSMDVHQVRPDIKF